MDTSPGPLSLLTHPYQELLPVGAGHDALRTAGRKPGSALIWSMGFSPGAGANPRVEARPGGLPVIVVLPRVAEITSDPDIIHVIQRCRPHCILPFHENPCAHDLAQVLRQPPLDLPAEVTDYLSWRGLGTGGPPMDPL